MASAEAVPASTLDIELVWAAGPHQVQQRALRLPAGSTAAAALRASGLAAELDAALLDTLTLAIWGRTCSPDTPLQQGDRLELLRALTVDPKEARRLRYRRDGVRKRSKRG